MPAPRAWTGPRWNRCKAASPSAISPTRNDAILVLRQAGAQSLMSKKTFIVLCFVPLAILVTAFFVLPMARLVIVGASGDKGVSAYAAILLNPRYRTTLI